MPTRGRCASATTPPSSASTTSGARCSTRCTCTARPTTTSTLGCGPSSPSRSTRPSTHWREPDAGIWEVRGEPQHFTSSKIMCWVAVDRGAHLAALIGQDAAADEWQKAADEIKDDILDIRRRRPWCLHPVLRHETRWTRRCCWPRSCDSCPPTTSGSSTRCAPSPTSSPKTAWCCGTGWRRPTTDSAARRARSRSARSGWCRRCARSATTAGPGGCAPGCCPSPVRSSCTRRRSTCTVGAHLGNFPQAFTHLALINAVLHVIGTADLADGEPQAPGAR